MRSGGEKEEEDEKWRCVRCGFFFALLFVVVRFFRHLNKLSLEKCNDLANGLKQITNNYKQGSLLPGLGMYYSLVVVVVLAAIVSM